MSNKKMKSRRNLLTWQPGETRQTKSGVSVRYDPGAEPGLEVDGKRVNLAPVSGMAELGLLGKPRSGIASICDLDAERPDFVGEDISGFVATGAASAADVLADDGRRKLGMGEQDNEYYGFSEPYTAYFPEDMDYETTPLLWTLLEIDSLLKFCLDYPQEVARVSAWKKAGVNSCRSIVDILAGTLDETVPVLWEPELWKFSQQGAAEAFASSAALVSDEPACIQYFTITRPSIADQASQKFYELDRYMYENGIGYALSGFLYVPFATLHALAGKNGVRFAAPAEHGFLPILVFAPMTLAGRTESKYSHLPALRLLPAVLAGNILQGGQIPFVAAWRFMHTKIVETAAEPVPRSERRRMEKSGRVVPQVRRILLRKRETVAGREGGDRAGYSCRFAVKKHWRKNHRDVDKPIFIDTYTKGPEGAPFRAPKTFTQVTR